MDTSPLAVTLTRTDDARDWIATTADGRVGIGPTAGAAVEAMMRWTARQPAPTCATAEV